MSLAPPDEAVAADVASLKAWLVELEAQLRGRAGLPLSRWYYGATFRVYARVGPAFAHLAKRPVVCLANIEAEQPGRGVMRAILAMLEGSKELAAEHVVVQNVHNLRLAEFLAAEGFHRWELFDGDSPSFSRALPKLQHQARMPLSGSSSGDYRGL